MPEPFLPLNLNICILFFESNISFKVSYLIVDEVLTELEMPPDPFGNDIPPSELPYREDKERPSIYKRGKIRAYRSVFVRFSTF